MARFAAKFGRYKHGVRDYRAPSVQFDGTRREELRELFIVFGEDPLTEDEIQLAVRSMVHTGLAIDRNTEEHFSARHRISGFDSESAQSRYDWTDNERELVEKKLRESQHYGTDHIELLPQPAQAPWPSYDKMDDPEVIFSVAQAIGLPIDDVLRYETQNANREAVLDGLRELQAAAAVEKAADNEPEVVIEA